MFKDVNGTISVESEALAKVSFPRTRFTTPIALAIFIFGSAPESPDVPVQHDEDDGGDFDFRVPCFPKSFKHGEELWFEGVDSKQCPKPVRSAVAEGNQGPCPR